MFQTIRFPLGRIVATPAALRCGARLLSSYSLGDQTLWLITDADRSVTTLLKPGDH